MGDRTSVTLTVLASQKGKAETFFDYHTAGSDYANGLFHEFHFHDVNYGNLPFLPELQAAGIAYDSRWDDGGDYKKGVAYCRFTPEGELDEKEIADDYINPALDTLLRLCEHPGALVQFIKVHQKKVTPLPWENQVEYGRLYQTKKLLALV